MPKLAPNKPVTGTRPILALGSDFEPGRYVFRLEVRDDAGNVSRPAQIVVTVEPKTKRGRPVRIKPGQILNPVVGKPTIRINPRLVNPGRIRIRKPK